MDGGTNPDYGWRPSCLSQFALGLKR